METEASTTETTEAAEVEQVADSADDVWGTAAPSEEELSGVDDSEEKTAGDEEKTTGDDSKEAETTEQETTEETETESNTASSESKSEEGEKTEQKTDGKPPKGFVPTQALHEVRGENSYLKQQIAELQAAATQAPQSQEGEVSTDEEGEVFKVLDDQELEELAIDDPSEAVLYMHKLNRHTQEQHQQQQAIQAEQALIVTARTEMEAAVPGLFDENSKAYDNLEASAKEIGFTDDMFYLTNPETMVLIPGEDTPRSLGQDAAKMVKMLASAKSQVGEKTDTEAVRAEIRAEVTKEVQAELLSKFKGDSDVYKSLSSLSAASGGDKSGGSGKSFGQMNEAERTAYLSGA